VASSSLGVAAGGGMFGDSRSMGSSMDCFSTHLGVTMIFCTVQAAMEALEIAKGRGWDQLWLEC